MAKEKIASEAASYLQRLAKEIEKGSNAPGKVASEEREAYPAVIELMTSDQDAAGKERELSKVSIFWQDGVWKIAITEPNLEMSAFASGSTLAALFASLEARLQEDGPDAFRRWNASWKAQGKGKGRKG